jgi:hypothetical protein
MKIKSREQIVDLMKHFKLPLIAAEVGVAEGRLSKELLAWGIERLYLIDIWEKVPFIKGCGSFEQKWHDDNYASVLEKIKGNEDKVIILKGFSYKMAEKIPNESLGMAYIDGDHTYEGARADIDSFWPKLVKGGIMVFHDAANPDYGIRNAMHDFTKGVGINMLEEDGEIENIGAWIQKPFK